MTFEVKQAVLAAARDIRDQGRPRSKNTGICINLDVAPLVTTRILKPIFRRWPKFSGDSDYPVPSCEPFASPRECYKFYPSYHKWNHDTQYCRDRWELLDFIIAELEKDLEVTK